jgi:hypothetical protein
VITLPHEAILLRGTTSIKDKFEKLLGNMDKGIKGYIDKGIVGAEDSYVVAVNRRLLRLWPILDFLHFAVEFSDFEPNRDGAGFLAFCLIASLCST